jgi:hypothetical protein
MDDPTATPLRLGNYEPLLELASGGMATVYVARQIGAAGFERIVVVKRVHRHLLGHRDFYDMFRDEARVASMVRHPNVVPVIDVVEIGEGEADKELFLVMEYVESSALATLRKAAHEMSHRIPVPIVARILYDALAGLHAAHTALDIQGRPLGVVHRDVSPQNIIVGVDGSSRLIDFGVAKASHRLTETRSGSVKGKYSYMAPEQARGQEVDRRTDVFAAGIVLHECLTDRRLFRGENELDTVRRIMEAEIPPPSSIQPAIPAALDDVVLKALARPPEERFQTAIEMAEALEAAVSLASHREVAAYLERACGSRLAERRDALREMLAGQVAPLGVALSKDPGDSQSSQSMRMEAAASEGSGTDGRIAVEAPPIPRDGKSRVALLAAVGVAAAAIGALVFVVSTRPKPPGSLTAVTTPPATVTATVTASAAPAPAAPKELTVVIDADAPIEGVRVPGSKRVEITGQTARIALDPWEKPLAVEVVFAGGKKTSATVRPGETSVHVDAPKPKPAVTTAAPHGTRPDLQGNPYGAP